VTCPATDQHLADGRPQAVRADQRAAFVDFTVLGPRDDPVRPLVDRDNLPGRHQLD
jgi:hypothetical protein